MPDTRLIKGAKETGPKGMITGFLPERAHNSMGWYHLPYYQTGREDDIAG